jgi:hypothetical protein
LGLRFSNDYYPLRQERGLRQYPVGGVLSGLGVTTGAVVTGLGTSSVSVTVQPGLLKLDAGRVSLASAVTKVITTPKDLSLATDQYVDIFVNPTRLILAQPTAPGSPTNGMKWLQTVDFPDYKQIIGYKIYDTATTSWLDFDPIKEKIGKGQMALPMNDIAPTIVAGNIVPREQIEKPVYNGTGTPVYVSNPAPAKARETAAVVIATVVINAGAVVSVGVPDSQKLPV